MFFTPGRIVGLIVFVVVLLVIVYVLKRLDAAIGPVAEEASVTPPVAPEVALEAVTTSGSTISGGAGPRRGRRKHGR